MHLHAWLRSICEPHSLHLHALACGRLSSLKRGGPDLFALALLFVCSTPAAASLVEPLSRCAEDMRRAPQRVVARTRFFYDEGCKLYARHGALRRSGSVPSTVKQRSRLLMAPCTLQPLREELRASPRTTTTTLLFTLLLSCTGSYASVAQRMPKRPRCGCVEALYHKKQTTGSLSRPLLSTSRLLFCEQTGMDEQRSSALSPRQVLLVDAEDLASLGLPPGALRENVVLRGVDVSALASGTVLRLGSSVELRVAFACEPCGHILDSMAAPIRQALEPSALKRLAGKRGVLATVVCGGAVSAGDECVVVSARTHRARPQLWCCTHATQPPLCHCAGRGRAAVRTSLGRGQAAGAMAAGARAVRPRRHLHGCFGHGGRARGLCARAASLS